MGMNVFSEFSPKNSVQQNYYNVSSVSTPKKAEIPTEKTKGEKAKDILKTALPIAIPLISIPITAGITYKLAAKNTNSLKDEINILSKEVAGLKALNEKTTQELTENLTKSARNNIKENAQIWSAIVAAAGLAGSYKAGQLSNDEKQTITNKISSRVSDIEHKSNEALYNSQESLGLSANSLTRKYTKNINGIQLLSNTSSLNKNEQKYIQAIDKIQKTAPRYLYEKPDVKPITKDKPVIWSVTSEFAPVKEGGLGSVPVEIQNNVTKLGIDIPTFIPMYQQKGIAAFRQEGNEYFYTYKGREFKLDKAVSFNIDSFKNGKSSTKNVEIFINTSKDEDGNDKKLVFIKNDDYFNGTIYQSSQKTEEPEKFAFFSKAVYELSKAKEDINSVKNLIIYNKKAFNSIQSPDGLILNDWQASPLAALVRYKAPIENAFCELSDDAASKLSNMRIITIGHNVQYQGSTRDNNDNTQRKEVTTNILNTLFDDFAYDIVTNANTNASSVDPTDFNLKNLDNVLILNKDDEYANHTNLLNMGICLSDYFHPVSQNYSKEIISDEHPELSGELCWILQQKNKAGSLTGIINGNDFNNLSIEAKKDTIKKQTGLDYKTYSQKSNIGEVMEARKENKINFYNNFIYPFSKKNDKGIKDLTVMNIKKITKNLEFVNGKGTANLPVLTDEELENTPVIASVGRLVSQKGINIMTEAIKLLMDNWKKDFPNKPKPIFYIAGQDGEGGRQRKYVEDLKDNKLSKEDSNRVIFAHGFAPMSAIASASDFFLLPSVFEPCGLTQSEAFAVGTPVIGSAVGGIVDTVNRGKKTNGILTNPDENLTPENFYQAMKQALEIYFNNPVQYQKMVKDSLSEDFSWIQKGKQGSVFDYLEKIGINISSLPDAA